MSQTSTIYDLHKNKTLSDLVKIKKVTKTFDCLSYIRERKDIPFYINRNYYLWFRT